MMRSMRRGASRWWFGVSRRTFACFTVFQIIIAAVAVDRHAEEQASRATEEALLEAVRARDAASLSRIISSRQPSDANHPDDGRRRRTPLHVAAEMGWLEGAAHLVAYCGVRDEAGTTAAMIAAKRGDAGLLAILDDCDDGAGNDEGWTSLMLASWSGCGDCVDQLMEGGRDGGRLKNGGTALLLAAIEGHSEVVALLLARGDPVNQADDTGSTALIWACYKGQLEVVRVLLEGGAETGVRNERGGTTAFLAAAAAGHADVLALMLGELLSEVNDAGDTIALVRPAGGLLLEVNDAGDTALVLACDNRRAAAVRSLLEFGADASEAKPGGFTPLMYAAQHGSVEIADLLVRHGADPEAVTHDGMTAAFIAESLNHAAVHALITAQNNDDDDDDLATTSPITTSSSKGARTM